MYTLEDILRELQLLNLLLIALIVEDEPLRIGVQALCRREKLWPPQRALAPALDSELLKVLDPPTNIRQFVHYRNFYFNG